MAHFDEIKTSFLGGEISPKARGRVDLDIYKAGCDNVENFIVRPHGGASRRPGTKYVGSTLHSNKIAILQEFNYRDEHKFILEFGEYYIRVYENQELVLSDAYVAWGPPGITGYIVGELVTNGGQWYRCLITHTASGAFATDLAAGKWAVTGGATDLVYQIVTPYTEAQLRELHFNSDDSILIITHPSHEPRQLEYPDLGINFISISVLNYYTHSVIPNTAGTLFAVGDFAALAQSGTSGVLGRVEVMEVNSVGGILLLKTSLTGEDYEIGSCNLVATFPSIGTGAKNDCTSVQHPAEWGAADYPSVSWFYEQRLYFAATPSYPNRIWGSQSASYYNFVKGTGLANEAIDITIKAAHTILWATTTDIITLGASNGEFLLVASDADKAITPSNIRPLRTTGYGSLENVPPSVVDSHPVFIQRGKRKIRRFEYDLSSSKYLARDLAVVGAHITESGIIDSTYTNEPDSIIWFLREDGKIAGLTYDPDNNAYAWHRHTLGGTDAKVISIAGINGVLPNQDELWVIVERTIDGSTVKYVEFFTQGTDDQDKEDSFYVDSGVTATGSDLATVTTLTHLEGETVQVLADGAVQSDKVVASGTIAVSPVADDVQAGLYYENYVDTLPIEAGNPLGTSQGKIKTIESVIFRVYRSLSFKFGVPGETLDSIMYEGVTIADDTALQTTDTEEMPYPGGADREGVVRFQQTDPLPLNVLAIMFKGSTDI